MKNKKILKTLKTLSITLAASILTGIVGISANAETTKDLTDNYGKITVNINSSRNAEIKIEKISKYEGTVTYYDKTYGNGKHDFTLDACEYNNGSYDSSYKLTVCDALDTRSKFTVDNIIVYDGGFKNQPSSTNYEYTVNITSNGKKRNESHTQAQTQTVNNIYTSTQTAKLEAVKLPGDLNDDNRVDAADATLILIHYATALNGGKVDDITDVADIDGDKKVDAADATRVLIYYATVLNGSKNAKLIQD